MNSYRDEIRETVESYLNIVLQADLAGWNGASVCRVYTLYKLRKVLKAALRTRDAEVPVIAASKFQRMVNDYLKRRNYSQICFM